MGEAVPGGTATRTGGNINADVWSGKSIGGPLNPDGTANRDYYTAAVTLIAPEPGSLALLAMGFLGAMLWRKREAAARIS